VQSDTVTIFLALFAMIGTVATLIVNAYILTRVSKVAAKTEQTHTAVDGAMHELLAASTGQAGAQGFTAGEQAERDRTANGNTVPPPV
jgi:hypothetical protein